MENISQKTSFDTEILHPLRERTPTSAALHIMAPFMEEEAEEAERGGRAIQARVVEMQRCRSPSVSSARPEAIDPGRRLE